MMIVVRSISGALNGNVAVSQAKFQPVIVLTPLQVIKASLGDITDESNWTEAFAMYGLTWTVGSIIGCVPLSIRTVVYKRHSNAMGGTLSHPYERFPRLFQGMEIFRTHPYFLRKLDFDSSHVSNVA